MFGRFMDQTKGRSRYGVVMIIMLIVSACCIEHASAIPTRLRTLIRQAIPDEIIAEPENVRRILIVAALTEDPDDATHVAETVVRTIGRQTGAFTVTIDEDGDIIDDAESLFGENRFAAIVLVNDASALFAQDDLREKLVKYVKSGGGLVVLGDGLRTGDEWPEFRTLAGAQWELRSGDGKEVKLQVVGLEHRINQCFDTPSYTIKGSVCRLAKDSFSSHSSRMLLSVIDRGLRGDGPRTLLPVSWIRRAGVVAGGADQDGESKTVGGEVAGRVFCMTLGATEGVYVDSRIISHLRRGLQFATGDLEADATPSDDLEVLLTLGSCLAEIHRVGEGGSRWAMSIAAELLYDAVQSGESDRASAEEEMLRLLRANDVTKNAKLFAVRELRITGGEEAFTTLTDILGSDDVAMRDEAIFALSQFPSATVKKGAGAGPSVDEVNIRLFTLASDESKPMLKRADCLSALRARSASEYLDQIHDTMMNAQDDALRHAAIRCVGSFDHPYFKYGRELIHHYLATDDETDAQVCADALTDMFRPGNGQLAYGSYFSSAINKDKKIDEREAVRACGVAKEVGGYRGSQMIILLGRSNDPAVWKAMEDALLHWPDAVGNKAVMILIEQQKVPVNRKALLEVFVRMIGEMEESPALFRATGLERALGYSEWDSVDVQAFRALSYIDDFSSIDAVFKALEEKPHANAKTAREAARALVIVTEKIGNENIGKGETALNKAIELLATQQDDDTAKALTIRAKKALEGLKG